MYLPCSLTHLQTWCDDSERITSQSLKTEAEASEEGGDLDAA